MRTNVRVSPPERTITPPPLADGMALLPEEPCWLVCGEIAESCGAEDAWQGTGANTTTGTKVEGLDYKLERDACRAKVQLICVTKTRLQSSYCQRQTDSLLRGHHNLIPSPMKLSVRQRFHHANEHQKSTCRCIIWSTEWHEPVLQ